MTIKTSKYVILNNIWFQLIVKILQKEKYIYIRMVVNYLLELKYTKFTYCNIIMDFCLPFLQKCLIVISVYTPNNSCVIHL